MENPVLKVKVLRWPAHFLLFCAVGITSATGQAFTSVFAFDGENGRYPDLMSLVQGVDGRLYGTTAYGSRSKQGTVFAIGPAGLEVLHSFCSQGPPCTDGSQPTAGLVLATDGYFYGTTEIGGDSCNCGTIFKIDRRGKRFFTVHEFEQNDGRLPYSPLIQAADSFFYGTTVSGGPAGLGTIFKMSLNGALVVLHTFAGTDGVDPYAGLVQASDGNFYGTTYFGGFGCAGYGCGTVFKITPSGRFTTLHFFCSQMNCTDGAIPFSGLIQGADGKLYGTTTGAYGLGHGTVFSIATNGTLATIYSFCALPNCADGQMPTAGLAIGSDGNLYGTTVIGGTNGSGTAFSITPAGKLTTLYSFCSEDNCGDGANPEGGLTQGTDGRLYGTTFYGGSFTCLFEGTYGCGTIFGIDTDLPPFVTFVRAVGRVGGTVGILGQGFTGTTSVSLNGTPASFTVVSDTFLKATVPAGATTGYVTVTTPSGTLTSNVPFHVIP
jgi:uncharacterized repeat protein (TIGR03803 family)